MLIKTLSLQGDSNCGTPLNNYLKQLTEEEGCGINKFDYFSQRPTLTVGEQGETFLFIKTVNVHE